MSERVAIALTATGPYRQFLPGTLASIQRCLFCANERSLFLFTDDDTASFTGVSAFYVPHLPWPYNSLFRFHYIHCIRDDLANVDVIAAIDVDMIVENEILLSEVLTPQTNYFGVQHPSVGPNEGEFEVNPASTAWLDRSKFDTTAYWGGAFWGGRTKSVIPMTKLLAERIQTDLDNGIMAIWHDQTHLDRFYAENKLEVNTLNPGFLFPDGEIADKSRPSLYAYPPRIRCIDKSYQDFPCPPGPPDGQLINVAPVPRPL